MGLVVSISRLDFKSNPLKKDLMGEQEFLVGERNKGV